MRGLKTFFHNAESVKRIFYAENIVFESVFYSVLISGAKEIAWWSFCMFFKIKS